MRTSRQNSIPLSPVPTAWRKSRQQVDLDFYAQNPIDTFPRWQQVGNFPVYGEVTNLLPTCCINLTMRTNTLHFVRQDFNFVCRFEVDEVFHTLGITQKHQDVKS